jgi:hypothetical protein
MFIMDYMLERIMLEQLVETLFTPQRSELELLMRKLSRHSTTKEDQAALEDQTE